MPSPSGTRWCFTLNNWTPAELDLLIEIGEDHANRGIVYLVIGREQGESGTPHLQGFVVLQRNHRRPSVQRTLHLQRAHLEVARGTSLQASTYCKKDGDFLEYGTIPGSKENHRNGFDSFREWALQQPFKPTAAAVALEFPGLFIRYGRIMEWLDLVYPVNINVDGELRPWQRHLAADLESPPDDRKIYFVVDPEGGAGKSWFIKYFYSKHSDDTQILSIGKRDDVAFTIDESRRYFLFDLPRSTGGFLQYSVLEQLKDRIVFSPKYGSRTKVLTHVPHVVVFTNEQPDYTKLSRDRFITLQVSFPVAEAELI